MPRRLIRYPDGQIRCRKQTLNRDRNCYGTKEEWFHPNGNKAREQHSENGTLHGDYKVWYENGSVEFSATYKYGQLHGTYMWNFGNGKKASEGSRYEGKQHGNLKIWGIDGELIQERDYVMGYPKETVMIILKYLRKAKLYRFARLIKTRAFIE